MSVSVISFLKIVVSSYEAYVESQDSDGIELLSEDVDTRIPYISDHVARRRSAIIDRFKSKDIYERDNGICWICDEECPRTQASIDHLVPLSKGGPHALFNVRLAHKECNNHRGAAYPDLQTVRLVRVLEAIWRADLFRLESALQLNHL